MTFFLELHIGTVYKLVLIYYFINNCYLQKQNFTVIIREAAKKTFLKYLPKNMALSVQKLWRKKNCQRFRLFYAKKKRKKFL